MPNVDITVFNSIWKNEQLITIFKGKQSLDIQIYSIALLAIIKSWYNNWQQEITIYTTRDQDLILIALNINHETEFTTLIQDIQKKIIQARKVKSEINDKNQLKYFAGNYLIADKQNEYFDYAIDIHINGAKGYFNSRFLTKKLNNNYISNIEHVFINSLSNPTLNLGKLVKIDNTQWRKIYKLSHPPAYKNLPSVPVHTQIIQQAKKYSKKIALKDKNSELTYKELDSLSTNVAVIINKNLSKTEARIGICVQRNIEFIVTLIGILRSGASFVPLDPSIPENRLEFIVKDSELDLLLIDKKYSWLSKIETKIIYIQQIFNTKLKDVSFFKNIKTSLYQEAYIIYTSGTSGVPKGVSISHKSLNFYANTALNKFKIKESDYILQFSSLNFDAMIEEIFPCLLAGATLVLRDDKSSYDIQHFINMINKFSITILDLPTGYWREISHYLETFNLKLPLQLRLIIIGGETLFYDDVRRWFSITDSTSYPTLFNTYGPTEATVVSSIYKVSNNNSSTEQNPSIGKPIPGAKILLINRLGEICPLGGTGELYIGGPGLAIGYIGSEAKDKNSNKFISLSYKGKYLGNFYRTGDLGYYLDTGELQYIDRIDNQVKIRGFRVELNEINTVLSSFHKITNAITLAIKLNLQTNLVAFITTKQNLYHKKSILRHLKLYLPEYMLPTDVILLKKLPKLINGKIDISYLTNLYLEEVQKSIEDNSIFLEKTYTEKILIKIWKEVLGTIPPSINISFFECGGNSLNAIRFSNFIQVKLNIKFSARQLYSNSSIKKLANIINKNNVNISLLSNKNKEQEIKFDPLRFQEWRYKESIIKLNTSAISTRIPLSQENVLLTGSTGFLGSHMLYSLLKNTEGKIFCLTRGVSELEIEKRIKYVAQMYKINLCYDQDRIIPLPGDIGKSMLGLSKHKYNTISKEITRIFHCAADTNMLLPYENSITSNVIGTKNILEFATKNLLKKVEYISTMAIFDCNPKLKNINIDTEIDEVKVISSGYAQSKWIADKLVTYAIKQGLDLRIYRCGRIWGNLKNYLGPDDDFLIRFLKGCLLTKTFPTIDMMLDILPVDFITETIIQYANKFKSSESRILHLCNTNFLSLKDIINMLQVQGHTFSLINYEKWRNMLISHFQEKDAINNPLYPLISLFESSCPDSWSDNWSPCKKTEKILSSLDIKFPDIKELLYNNIKLV